MMYFYKFLFALIFIGSSLICIGQTVGGSINFNVSIEKPNTHYYHIIVECKSVKGEYIDFKLPAWTPGYYWLIDFSKNVINFKAEDDEGKLLSWNKTTKNTWHVKTHTTKNIKVSYDVYAFTQSVADPFLDDSHGYISPAGIFMYVDGQLQHASTITLHPLSDWKTVSTGLDPVAGQVNTFSAPNFDVLYDSPILMGNQEVLSFEVKGVPHYIALAEPEKFNKQKFADDLKRIVETASSVIGEFPYKHYTFLIMGEGRGGLEHLNSTAVFSSGTVYNNGDDAGYKRWLNFLTHEYFHLYNIKAIRPIALGPFDYDKENYTNMLWVSEGFTVYYEYIILNRAGIISSTEALDFLRGNIKDYENSPGHLFQSVTESSFDTWLNFFNHNENTANTTISYYDKGAALGMLLDLKICNETKNKKSLDDVMRALYSTYYKEKKRGFTDDEFKQTCEAIAGVSLAELFEYASTVKVIGYQKYFDYAGLNVDDKPEKLPGAYLGASIHENENVLSITDTDMNSPAWLAGLSSDDIILTVNGKLVTSKTLTEILNGKSAGDKIQLQYERRGTKHDVDITLAIKEIRNFKITKAQKTSALQAVIMQNWLKD
jgi:predicted metalloprotease with PDZ domain